MSAPERSTTTSAERRVLDAVDETELVDTLVELVRVPSVTGTDAEADLQHTVARWFEEAGLEVDLWPLDLDDLRADPDFPGTEAPRLEGHGLVGTASGVGEPGLVLQGHVDVVPVGDLGNWPERDPFSARIEGGVLSGRGACDMKAGVAVNLAVARALHRSGVRTERRLALHSVVSEEDGGLGAFATMRRGHRGEVAVITEPTSGRRGHGECRCAHLPHRGRRAARHTAAPVSRGCRRSRRSGRCTSPCGTSRRGATATGIRCSAATRCRTHLDRHRAGRRLGQPVPDLLVAEGRMGVRLGEDPAVARAALEEAVRGRGARPVAARPPAAGDVAGRAVRQRVGCPRLTRCWRRWPGPWRRHGPRPLEAAAPYGSDLRLYAAVGGIPTLHYGPGDVRLAHAPRESVPLAEVVDVARSLALVAARRLGAH